MLNHANLTGLTASMILLLINGTLIWVAPNLPALLAGVVGAVLALVAVATWIREIEPGDRNSKGGAMESVKVVTAEGTRVSYHPEAGVVLTGKPGRGKTSPAKLLLGEGVSGVEVKTTEDRTGA